MRKLILLAGVAAMATAMPALAQGRGGGHGGGHAQSAAPGHGGGHGRGGGNSHVRGPEVGHGGGQGRGHGRSARRSDDGPGHVRHSEHRQDRRAQRGEDRRSGRTDRHDLREAQRGNHRGWDGWLSGSRGNGRDARTVDRVAFWREGRPLPVSVARGGCPPGLAKHNAFCMPPGQLRHTLAIGNRIDRNRFGAVPQDWLYRFRDNDDFYYRYDSSGFVYRVDRDDDFVSSIIPLFGGLGIGQPLPIGYDAYNLPVPYRDLYADSDDWMYRYDDGAIYRVDSETRLIEGVVALLGGNPINVGAPLPSGYDAYNVPFDYRDRYADDADSMYRYSNGAIYEIDPTTQLVQALVEMIV
ncbi:MAG: hypothetical protein QOC65_1107 [Sphingomonadales bacterium]|nr:hypothetical protein [Sphingomonadales bacterium]